MAGLHRELELGLIIHSVYITAHLGHRHALSGTPVWYADQPNVHMPGYACTHMWVYLEPRAHTST